MAATLSQAAYKLLSEAGCSEVADDYVILGGTDLRILLSRRAVEDLNAQARGEQEFREPTLRTLKKTQDLSASPLKAGTAYEDPYLAGITAKLKR